uniref:Transcription factor HES-5 n=1 Tax=Salarias fasciatus TaxID=181472 RepID=A0A672JA92_SALFA
MVFVEILQYFFQIFKKIQNRIVSPQMVGDIRKPLVEKLRRERINSSIEQLKSLLGPDFLKQQPDSKLEKADILEMTVCFLTQLHSFSLSWSTACLVEIYKLLL